MGLVPGFGAGCGGRLVRLLVLVAPVGNGWLGVQTVAGVIVFAQSLSQLLAHSQFSGR